MRILSIDSSAGSTLAVVDTSAPAEQQILVHSTQPDSRKHAESLGPMLTAALTDERVAAQPLDAVVGATGPAPFTGLRAGLVTARTVGRARQIAVYGVPSLDAVARAAFDELASQGEMRPGLTVRVATDARRKEVYTAAYQAKGSDDVERLGALQVCSPAVVAEMDPADVYAGSGVQLYPQLAQGCPALLPISGSALAQVRVALARLAAGEKLSTEPEYLRHADVQMPSAPKHTL